MYFNILKRDLKRKKTMNCILLLFTILAAMFVASGLNNVVTVMNGTDYFFDKAGIRDYMVFTQKGDGGVTELLKKSAHVSGYIQEKCCWMSSDEVSRKGKKLKLKNNTMLIQPLQGDEISYFLPDNQPLTHIKQGELYLTAGILEKNHLKVGDELQIKKGNTNLTLQIAGEIKDALLGSDMMGNTRLLISAEDYRFFEQDESLSDFMGNIFHIDTQNTSAVSSELTEASDILFSGERSLIRMAYVMDLIVAMIVLALSVCLIIVSFVVLRFVITFSIREEYREIGVLKAIGIRNSKIRTLYITKYLVMALIGGVIGFVVSIPFGAMMIKSVSEKMFLGNDSGYFFNVIGSIVVMGLMVAFAYLCTGKVKKFTPIDAIRSGQTGERYQKKSVCRLSKTHMGTSCYLACNDILSSPKRFFIIMLSFFLCSIFVLGVVLVSDTMKSKNLIATFGKESDIYITDSKLMKMDLMRPGGDKVLQDRYREIEEDLAREGMPGKLSMEVWYKYPCEVDGKNFSVIFQKNTETSTEDYEYIEGTAPRNADEIAITPVISEQIGAKIGDVVTVDFGMEKRDCMVVAYFQTMNQLGKVIRLHEEAPASMEYASAMMAFQIDFDDHPDAQEISRRVKKIKKMYGVSGVYDAAGYCMDCIGVAGVLDSVSMLLILITGIVVILVTVLMERSFISDETAQIALLKAVGFVDRGILKWHIFRFMIVAFVAEFLAVTFTVPITKLWCDPIWAMMGAVNVKYHFNPLNQLLIYPGIILLITCIAVWFTALYTKKIKSTDVMNIE